MTQPTPYRRGYDFSDAGGATPPGGPLDDELDDVGLTLSQILRNLALIQRDDTALRNGIVGIDALDSRVLGLISGGTFSIAGTWATDTAYPAGAFLTDDGAIYLVMEAHTSTTIVDDLAAGHIAKALQNEQGTRLRDDFVGNAVQTEYTLSQSPARPTDVEVYVDGALVPADEYVQTGATVTFLVAPANGAKISIFSITWATAPPIQTLVDAVGDRNTEISAATDFLQDVADNGGAVFVDDLAATGGADDVGFIANVTDAVARTAEAKLRDVINAKDFGVVADGVTDDTVALQNAIDYMTSNEVDGLVLPRGEILLSGDVTIPPHSGVTDYNRSVSFIGQGAGENGTFLHFTTGSLIVNASSHYLANFQVTSDNTNGIEVKPSTGTVKYPARSMMVNISAYDCAESGITIEDCWVYVMVNIMARRNTKYGIEGKAGVNFSTACNGWKIIGGEFQGNGAAVASGASKSTGGGIFTGRCVNLGIDGANIEGNVGDGLVLGEQLRGLKVDGGYFEKNGSNHLDCDIRNDAPSSPAFGPNSIFIVNPNFTPQATNGTVQERAIDLYDVIDLKIVNPQFFEEGAAGVYSAPPIRVRETLDGRCTGWVEGGAYLSLNYTQDMVKNETFRFGYPTRHRFSPDLALPDAATTTSQRFYAPMSNLAGRRVDVNHYTRPNAATGTARIVTTIRRGPAGSSVSVKNDDVVYASSVNSKTQVNFTSYTAAPWGQAEVTVAREGAHANDTLAADTRLLCVEIITYEGRVAAGA